MGTLAADQPYLINVDNTASGNNKTALTVYYLTGGKPETPEREARLGRATKFDLLIAAAAARETFTREIPKGTRRIVIEIAPPRNVTVLLEVAQGTSSFPEACVAGCTLTFDVE